LFIVWVGEQLATLELIGFSETVAEWVFLYRPVDGIVAARPDREE
jgi:hypothetical protein